MTMAANPETHHPERRRTSPALCRHAIADAETRSRDSSRERVFVAGAGLGDRRLEAAATTTESLANRARLQQRELPPHRFPCRAWMPGSESARLPRFDRRVGPGDPRCGWGEERCVRDARPEGREPAGRPRRHVRGREEAAAEMDPPGPGAVGHGGIVPYGARSPVGRLGAQHARALLFRGPTVIRNPPRPGDRRPEPLTPRRA